MEGNNTYDVAIIGGGLAGLALSIQLARNNHEVVLFEKEIPLLFLLLLLGVVER